MGLPSLVLLDLSLTVHHAAAAEAALAEVALVVCLDRPVQLKQDRNGVDLKSCSCLYL